MMHKRFVLTDPKDVGVPKIDVMTTIQDSFTQARQFQVIIGNTVANFYNASSPFRV